jgi:hypothetical protein
VAMSPADRLETPRPLQLLAVRAFLAFVPCWGAAAPTWRTTRLVL